MRMSTPYVGRPDDFGILTMNQEETRRTPRTRRTAGFQIGVHANGDVAIDMVLKAYEKVARADAARGIGRASNTVPS